MLRRSFFGAVVGGITSLFVRNNSTLATTHAVEDRVVTFPVKYLLQGRWGIFRRALEVLTQAMQVNKYEISIFDRRVLIYRDNTPYLTNQQFEEIKQASMRAIKSTPRHDDEVIRIIGRPFA